MRHNLGMNLELAEIKKLLTQDQRRSERLNLPIKIFYCLPPDSRWIGPIAIDDIGGHGLKFKIPERLTKNTELNLKISLPDDSNPIIVKGLVMWSKKTPEKQNIYEIGIKFRKMNYQDRQKYVKYICSNILLKYLDNTGKIKA